MSYKSYMERREEKQRKRTTPSRARKGFPLKLQGHYIVFLQMAHSWLKVRGRTTPGIDEAITLVPDYELTKQPVGKTLRVRGHQIPGMIELLETAVQFAGAPSTLYSRIDDLKKITTADALMDAGR